jgi:hypothetical protein
VDVKQIGEVAKNTATAAAKTVAKAADVNGDGKLGLDDAKAAVTNTTKAVTDTAKSVVNNAKNTVSNAANTVKGWFHW